MATSYSVLVDSFLDKIIKDKRFFNYRGLDEEESLALAKERAQKYLDEAVNRIIFEGFPEVDFTNRSSTEFNFDLTPTEIILIPSLMLEAYMQQDIAYLKLQNVNFTGTEVRIFDPSNARKTFMAMYDDLCVKNAQMLARYADMNRSSGAYKNINFDTYDVNLES